MADDNNQSFMLKRISDLESEIHATRTEAKKYRLRGKATTKELEDLKVRYAEVEKTIEESRANPDPWQAKYQEIQKQLWSRDHRDAWTPVARERLVDGVPIEEIWSKIGYTPGDRVPDSDAIVEHLAKAQKAAPYLFRAAGTATQAPTATPESLEGAQDDTNARGRLAIPPGMGLGRGARSSGPTELVIKRSQLQTPGFYHQNKKSITEADRNGTLVVIDG